MSFEQILFAEEKAMAESTLLSHEDVAVRVSGISKCYHLYEKPQDRLRQSIYPRLQRMFKRTPKNYAREFWALKDISFDLKKGETLGIIGRNGSGKSTLLQILCGTLAPSSGSIETHGRTAALLELGAGFNPEFTGRENVYVNAAILGLRREEIDAKFDEIAAFADIGEFIDQPVKMYSSGMYVRLAFAVQIAVEPDILIVDEALAVGDLRFSLKCIRRMRELVDKGTSCVFVSHDMSSIVNFCKEAMWLDNGNIVQKGDAKRVTMNYSNFMSYGFMPPAQLPELLERKENFEGASLWWRQNGNEANGPELDNLSWIDLSHLPSTGMGGAKIVQLALCKKDDCKPGTTFSGGEECQILLRIRSVQRLFSPIICADFRDARGNLVFGLNTFFMNEAMPHLHRGGYMVLKFNFRMPLLLTGEYGVSVAIGDGDYITNVQHHIINEAIVVHILPTDLRQNHYLVVNEHCDCQVLFLSNGTHS